jgi:hypothetical protein
MGRNRSICRSVLLALVAVFAMSAVTTATASATLPEFKPVPAKKKFSSKGGTMKWTFDNGTEEMACAKSSATGEIASAKTVGGVVIVYTGCKSSHNVSGGNENCPLNSKGAKAEEIVTEPLTGELGTVAKAQATSEVGLRFKPVTGKKWFTVVENECTWEAVITGSTAAEVAVTGKKQTTNKLVAGLTKDKNDIIEIKLDSGVLEKPELVQAGSEMTNETTDELTFEEAVEVT